MSIVIYRKTDLQCVGSVTENMSVDAEITLNVIPNFGGVSADYGYIETDLTNFHLENIGGTITPVINLSVVQQTKIAEINQAAGDKINGGFYSYAEGKTDSTDAPVALLYKSDSDHREQLAMINYLAQQHKAGQLTDMPCSWKDASLENEPCHEISDDAAMQLYIELGKHILWCKQTSDSLVSQIMAAATVDEVNAVAFSDEPMPSAPTTTS